MPKIKNPQDGEILTARFNGKSKTQFPNLKKTKILILISIKDNEYCGQEYFFATAKKAINTHGFVTFLIADEIYWHNLKNKHLGDDEERSLREMANNLGDKRIEEHLHYFLQLLDVNFDEFNNQHKEKSPSQKIGTINEIASTRSNFEIVRWNNWINSKKHDFLEKKKRIFYFYQSNDLLINSIDKSAKNYATRHSGDNNTDTYSNSKDYFTEESPGVIYIAALLGYNFIAYPGDLPKCFATTREFFIRASNEESIISDSDMKDILIRSDRPKALVNWLHINFRKDYTEKPNIANNPNNFFPPNFDYENALYVVTRAILDYPVDNTTKIDLIVGIVNKLKALDSNNAEAQKVKLSHL